MSEIVKYEDWKQLAKVDKGGGVPLPFVQELFLLECKIAGTSFVQDIEKKVSALSIGEELSLVREGDNKHDSFAILVNNASEGKLGYVPRRKNKVLSRLMDGGKILYGKVVNIGKFYKYSKNIDITIKIYMKDL